jgi:hypothetical protein
MKYTHTTDALTAHLDGEAVVLNARTHEYFRLNETGQAIWKQLQQGATLESIVADLASAFDVAEEQAEADARELLRALEAAQLIDAVQSK